jgi:hypothetical protein
MAGPISSSLSACHLCTDTSYKWGAQHWSETTWNKVRVVAAVHDLGFHVIHSDTDVTWFRVRRGGGGSNH